MSAVAPPSKKARHVLAESLHDDVETSLSAVSSVAELERAASRTRAVAGQSASLAAGLGLAQLFGMGLTETHAALLGHLKRQTIASLLSPPASLPATAVDARALRVLEASFAFLESPDLAAVPIAALSRLGAAIPPAFLARLAARGGDALLLLPDRVQVAAARANSACAAALRRALLRRSLAHPLATDALALAAPAYVHAAVAHRYPDAVASAVAAAAASAEHGDDEAAPHRVIAAQEMPDEAVGSAAIADDMSCSLVRSMSRDAVLAVQAGVAPAQRLQWAAATAPPALAPAGSGAGPTRLAELAEPPVQNTPSNSNIGGALGPAFFAGAIERMNALATAAVIRETMPPNARTINTAADGAPELTEAFWDSPVSLAAAGARVALSRALHARTGADRGRGDELGGALWQLAGVAMAGRFERGAKRAFDALYLAARAEVAAAAAAAAGIDVAKEVAKRKLAARAKKTAATKAAKAASKLEEPQQQQQQQQDKKSAAAGGGDNDEQAVVGVRRNRARALQDDDEDDDEDAAAATEDAAAAAAEAEAQTAPANDTTAISSAAASGDGADSAAAEADAEAEVETGSYAVTAALALAPEGWTGPGARDCLCVSLGLPCTPGGGAAAAAALAPYATALGAPQWRALLAGAVLRETELSVERDVLPANNAALDRPLRLLHLAVNATPALAAAQARARARRPCAGVCLFAEAFAPEFVVRGAKGSLLTMLADLHVGAVLGAAGTAAAAPPAPGDEVYNADLFLSLVAAPAPPSWPSTDAVVEELCAAVGAPAAAAAAVAAAQQLQHQQQQPQYGYYYHQQQQQQQQQQQEASAAAAATEAAVAAAAAALSPTALRRATVRVAWALAEAAAAKAVAGRDVPRVLHWAHLLSDAAASSARTIAAAESALAAAETGAAPAELPAAVLRSAALRRAPALLPSLLAALETAAAAPGGPGWAVLRGAAAPVERESDAAAAAAAAAVARLGEGSTLAHPGSGSGSGSNAGTGAGASAGVLTRMELGRLDLSAIEPQVPAFAAVSCPLTAGASVAVAVPTASVGPAAGHPQLTALASAAAATAAGAAAGLSAAAAQGCEPPSVAIGLSGAATPAPVATDTETQSETGTAAVAAAVAARGGVGLLPAPGVLQALLLSTPPPVQTATEELTPAAAVLGVRAPAPTFAAAVPGTTAAAAAAAGQPLLEMPAVWTALIDNLLLPIALAGSGAGSSAAPVAAARNSLASSSGSSPGAGVDEDGDGGGDACGLRWRSLEAAAPRVFTAITAEQDAETTAAGAAVSGAGAGTADGPLLLGLLRLCLMAGDALPTVQVVPLLVALLQAPTVVAAARALATPTLPLLLGEITGDVTANAQRAVAEAEAAAAAAGGGPAAVAAAGQSAVDAALLNDITHMAAEPCAWSALSLASLLASPNVPLGRALALLRVTDIGVALVSMPQSAVAALNPKAALAWAGVVRLAVVAVAKVAWAVSLGGEDAKQALRPAALRSLRAMLLDDEANIWPPPPFQF